MGHKGGALMNGITALEKGPKSSFSVLPTMREYREASVVCRTGRETPLRTYHDGTPGSQISSPQLTGISKFLLFIRHLICDALL